MSETTVFTSNVKKPQKLIGIIKAITSKFGHTLNTCVILFTLSCDIYLEMVWLKCSHSSALVTVDYSHSKRILYKARIEDWMDRGFFLLAPVSWITLPSPLPGSFY